MKFASRFAKVTGATTLAIVLAAGLSACGTPSAEVNQDYLVITNVTEIECPTAPDDLKTVTDELQATADFVETAGVKTTTDILKLNEGLTSLKPLSAALSDKIEECNTSGGTSTPTPTPTPTDGPKISNAFKASLDASRAPTGACVAIVEQHGDKIYDDGTYLLRVEPSMGTTVKEDGDPTHLQWSDALDLILQGNTPEEKKTNLEYAICTRPLIGMSLGHLYAHQPLVLEQQKTDWLEVANVSEKRINDAVDAFVPYLFIEGDLTDQDYQDAFNAAKEYSSFASKLLFLLDRYELGQVMPINSYYSYHLVDGGRSADQTPEVEITHELDNRPALVFYLTEKTDADCVPISVLAFNVGDKRPELAEIPSDCTTLIPPPPPTTHYPTCEELGNCDTCPPGNEIPECAPKDTDGSGYIYLDGKGGFGAGTLTGDTQVTTEQTGGGGVLDSSSNNAGTETGAQTGGASTIGTETRNFGGNQGGDNGAGDGGGF